MKTCLLLGLILALAPTAYAAIERTYEGVVLYPDGKPVVAAPVQLRKLTDRLPKNFYTRHYHPEKAALAETSTDQDGRFRLTTDSELPSEQLQLWVKGRLVDYSRQTIEGEPSPEIHVRDVTLPNPNADNPIRITVADDFLPFHHHATDPIRMVRCPHPPIP